MRIGIDYHGGSFLTGVMAAAIYAGWMSPWWALAVPVLLLDIPALAWRWSYPKQ